MKGINTIHVFLGEKIYLVLGKQ